MAELAQLLKQIRGCKECDNELPLGANPVVRASSSAKLLIVGQAPGTKVHKTSIPWNDPSGDKLREWLSLDRDTFYDESKIAIMPMGFCYPGKGKSGDLPPRKECAALWHEQLIDAMPSIELVLLVGQYAQKHYLAKEYPEQLKEYKTLTQRVQHWQEFLPHYLPTPHPSPRNRLWLKRNPWFESEVVPYLRHRVELLLG